MQIKRLHFPTIDSTNSWAKQNSDKLDQECITLIHTSKQAAGRGRFNHVWHSPPNKNISATFAFFLSQMRKDLANISQILALAAAETLNEKGYPVKIKWPNDLMVAEKKLGGVLCETVQCGNKLLVIAGIGMNINTTEQELMGIGRPATSLYLEQGIELEPDQLLEQISLKFQEYLATFFSHGFAPFYKPFTESLCHKLHDQMQFHDHHKIMKGSFEKINPDGSLAILLEDGKVQKFTSGEIQ